MKTLLHKLFGHSLENTCFNINGCICLSSANILRIRGDAMQNAVKNIETSMVAVIGMAVDDFKNRSAK